MQPLTQEQIDAYVAHVQGLQDQYFAKMGYTFAAPPRITFDMGGRYVRIVLNECDKEGNMRPDARSVHTFLDQTNGDILKSATWKAPAKNGVRANINVAGWEARINHNGANYLR